MFPHFVFASCFPITDPIILYIPIFSIYVISLLSCLFPSLFPSKDLCQVQSSSESYFKVIDFDPPNRLPYLNVVLRSPSRQIPLRIFEYCHDLSVSCTAGPGGPAV
jgi:hypothetical protein